MGKQTFLREDMMDALVGDLLIDKSGDYPIYIGEKEVGKVHVCLGKEHTHISETHVSVQLKDTFLTLEQMMSFLKEMKNRFDLPDNQRISIDQL